MIEFYFPQPNVERLRAFLLDGAIDVVEVFYELVIGPFPIRLAVRDQPLERIAVMARLVGHVIRIRHAQGVWMTAPTHCLDASSFLRRYHVRSLIPTASHGFCARRVLSSSPRRGRPPRGALAGAAALFATAAEIVVLAHRPRPEPRRAQSTVAVDDDAVAGHVRPPDFAFARSR